MLIRKTVLIKEEIDNSEKGLHRILILIVISGIHWPLSNIYTINNTTYIPLSLKISNHSLFFYHFNCLCVE